MLLAVSPTDLGKLIADETERKRNLVMSITSREAPFG
jgi:hypothetical protein